MSRGEIGIIAGTVIAVVAILAALIASGVGRPGIDVAQGGTPPTLTTRAGAVELRAGDRMTIDGTQTVVVRAPTATGASIFPVRLTPVPTVTRTPAPESDGTEQEGGSVNAGATPTSEVTATALVTLTASPTTTATEIIPTPTAVPSTATPTPVVPTVTPVVSVPAVEEESDDEEPSD